MRTAVLMTFLFLGTALRAEWHLVSILDGDRCGYADPSGTVVIPPQFRDCGDFAEGLAPVQVDDKWGYIDETGSVVIAPQFTSADAFSERMAFVGTDVGKAVIDRKGSVLFQADYYEHRRFHEGLAAVRPVKTWDCFKDNVSTEIQGADPHKDCAGGQLWPKDILWGYIDTSGAMAIPPQFILAQEFNDGLAQMRDGYVDRRGNVVIPGPFLETTPFKNGLAAMKDYSLLWGYVNQSGGVVVPPMFEEAKPIEDGRALVKLSGKYGFIDATGAMVIATQYDEALSFSEDLAAVRQGGKWGYINPSGKVAIPFQFDSAQSFRDGSAVVTQGSRLSVIDRKGVVTKFAPPTLRQTYQRLQGFEVEPDKEGPMGELFPILSVYKEQLRDLAAETLKRSTAATEVKTAIEKELSRAGIRKTADKFNETRPYGLLDDFEVLQPPEQPELLAIQFDLNLAHSTASSLTLFHRDRSGANEIFREEYINYSDDELKAAGVGVLQFTRDDNNGSFLMLLSTVSGMGADGSYGLSVDLFRFNAKFSQRKLFTKGFGVKGHQIEIEQSGFRLETVEPENDIMGAGYRVYPYRYEAHGDDVVRLAPIGYDAHDFLGAWGNLSWQEAARWSDQENLSKIHDWFGKVRDGETFVGMFPDVQACDPQKTLWQIAFTKNSNDAPVYFLIEQKDQSTFLVKSISDKQLEGCSDVDRKSLGKAPSLFDKSLGPW